MSQIVLASVTSVAISVLVTFFFSVLIGRRTMDDSVHSSIRQHEAVHHQEKVREVVEHVVSKHANDCPAPEDIREVKFDIQTVKTALIFLVAKQGGNPAEMGLI
jgi:hypothetical protein